MKIKFPWTKPADEDLAQLEDLLSITLTPIAPRPDFTTDLQDRLKTNMPAPAALAAETRPSGQYWTFWGLMAVVGSLLLVLTGFRFYAALLGALGIISGFSGRPTKNKRAASLKPAA